MKIEEKNSNIKEELEEKENSKSINNNLNSINSQEISKRSKSKETLENMEENKNKNQINQINLFKNSASSKNSSSQKLNQRYNTNENENEKENEEEKSNKDAQNEEYKPKFMQINPHFNIFNKQINSLRDSIYDDTKRCLILKGSLQQSSNFLREESNGLIKEIVEKIYNLRELFENGNKGLNQTTQDVQEGLIKLKDIQSKARKEIINCDKRITKCEEQIGYKLLGNPSYSFLKNINDKKVKTQK